MIVVYFVVPSKTIDFSNKQKQHLKIKINQSDLKTKQGTKTFTVTEVNISQQKHLIDSYRTVLLPKNLIAFNYHITSTSKLTVPSQFFNVYMFKGHPKRSKRCGQLRPPSLDPQGVHHLPRRPSGGAHDRRLGDLELFGRRPLHRLKHWPLRGLAVAQRGGEDPLLKDWTLKEKNMVEQPISSVTVC